MKYRLRVADIESYDTQTLKNEILSAGLNIQQIFAGAGTLLLEFENALTEEQKTILQGVISNHAPIWFEWTDNGMNFKEKVRCAEDVDKITSRRIRSLIGGIDPVQEQMKILRISAWVHDVFLFPEDYTQEEKNKAAQIRASMLGTNRLIEVFRQEGAAFKQDRGWN